MPSEEAPTETAPGGRGAQRPGTPGERFRVALTRPLFGTRSREENIAIVVVAGCVIVSCLTFLTFKGAPHPSWSASVRGVPIRYVLSGPNTVYLGRAHTFVPFSPCLVEVALDPTWTSTLSFTSFAAWISAHELAHCLDSRLLGFHHNDIARYATPDTRKRNDETNPAELFAESYAEAFLRKCGDNLHALGWKVAGPECEPPDPASVIHPGSGLTYQLEQKDKLITHLRNLQRELAGRPFPGHPATTGQGQVAPSPAVQAPARPVPAPPVPQ